MIRVGIEFAYFDESWLGGISGIRNLVRAIAADPERRIEIVLIAGHRTPERLFDGMGDVTVERTDLVDPASWGHKLGRLSRRLLGRNIPLERWLKAHDIQVFSHCLPLGRSAGVPTIGQIADFGFKHFAHLYDPAAQGRMEAGTRRIVDEYDVILMPSQAVADELAHFYPDARAAARAVHIIPSSFPPKRSSAEELAARYAIPLRFIFSPNHFWVHKDHATILEALKIAREKGTDVPVVFTGKEHDPRRPDHFAELTETARRLGVDDLITSLGVIDYDDVVDLMRHSAAVLSASLYEGWGSSVAEARMLGKRILLTDIAVFREQDPARASFFAPGDAEALATLLIEAWQDRTPDAALDAEAERADRMRLYAKEYQAVIDDAVAMHRARRKRPSC